LIFRVLGTLFLLVGFVVHFWITPKKGVSKAELAAANVARMEASVQGRGGSSLKKSKPDGAIFLQKLKSQKKREMEYLSIFVMIMGSLSLGYSFFKKKE